MDIAALTVLPLVGLPELRPGDDLAAAILDATVLHDGDVVVVSQKVVSKVEGALADPPPVADGQDPRRELARQQAVEIVADAPFALIVRTRTGLVCANAGIDASNVPGGKLSLLPADPDASARALRQALGERAGVVVAVIVSDTFGRPWRLGQTDIAIGVAGMAPLRDERGTRDRSGDVLSVTEAAVADELAGAADLVRTKAAGVPVVVVRGFPWQPSDTAAATDLVRAPEADLFARGRGMLATALTGAAWPSSWAGGVAGEELQRVGAVAPGVAVLDAGPPGRLAVDDHFAAGLAAAVLADLGLRVRWHVAEGRVILEAGRPAAAG